MKGYGLLGMSHESKLESKGKESEQQVRTACKEFYALVDEAFTSTTTTSTQEQQLWAKRQTVQARYGRPPRGLQEEAIKQMFDELVILANTDSHSITSSSTTQISSGRTRSGRKFR